MLTLEELMEKAEAGDGIALFLLGKSYQRGTHGAEQDLDAARKYYVDAFPKIQKLAEEGDPHGQFYLGRYYKELRFLLFKASFADQINDEDTGIMWYTRAAEQGLAEAQYELGMHYWTGDGYPKAFSLFTQAAEQGHTDAQNTLARCYESGFGTEVDKEAALLWFTKSAELGNARAKCNLGRCYEEGTVTARDYTKAFYWFSKSVESGDHTALGYLGACYEKGKGVEKNLDKAFALYTQGLPNDWAKNGLRRIKKLREKETR